MGKKKGKHVLMPPLEIKWPTLDKDTEEKIISALTLKLQEFPSLESKRRKDGRKKLGEESSSSSSLPRPALSPQDEEQMKARLRQQLVIGFRQVSKALEWNQLVLVLTAGTVQPPVLVQGLYMLVAGRKCPALCFPTLHPWLTSAIGIDNILALGFKKTDADGPNDFGDFVTMAAALAPPLMLPGASPSSGESTAGRKGDSTRAGGASVVGEEESTTETASPDKKWQVMGPEKEKVVMDKLLELLTPYKAILQTPKSKLTPDDLQTRKSINSCIPMDLGTVRKAAESGHLDLVLLQKEAGSSTHPVMAAIVRATTATTTTTTEKGCAMLHLATLRTGLTAVVQGTPVRAVGFRKTQFTSTQQSDDKIRQFVTMATQYSPTRPDDTSASNPCTDNSSAQQKQGQSSSQSETGQKQRQQQQPKFFPPVYDVSSLYVYKKTPDDENKSITETQQKKNSSSADDIYISLSSEPTVQYLGVKSLSNNNDNDDDDDNEVSIPGSAFVDSRGSGVPGKSLMAGKASATREESESTNAKSGAAGFSGVMGLDAVDAPAVPSSAYRHEPRGKKPKANLKRALDESSDRGEFVSFNMRRTDIRLSVPNPNKKKKNKKFKKK